MYSLIILGMMSNDDCSICCKILLLLCQQKELEQAKKTFESAMEAQQVRQEIYCMYSIHCITVNATAYLATERT